MKSIELIPLRIRGSVRLVSLCAAAAAVTMGIATVTSSPPGVGGNSAIVNADATTLTSPNPATTPAVASAAPRVTATKFAGKDWPGRGSFGEHWR